MANSGRVKLTGEKKQWHKITLDFDGPQASENSKTFLDHRLDVTFRHQGTGETVTVPGYFAADGDAADTNASSGSVWRAHFNPPKSGNWTWEASFRTGDDVAVKSAKAGSSGGPIDGKTGSISVGPSNKGGDDLRGKGMLEYDGDQYLNFAGTGEVFLKSGVGSPENFLAYSGFDNTPDSHSYQPHVKHHKGGPTWDGGKGKGIIGAANYLADDGVNSAYIMLNTVGGDGRDVWPWAATDLDGIRKNAGNSDGSFNLTIDARSFDVSKLDQWEIVFEHMQKKGITLHLFFQETENDFLLNDGDMGTERELFMREMVARFGHHNGIIWNLGEENTNTANQVRAHSRELKALDPYDHPVALHTFPTQHAKYDQFDGSNTLDVLSFQTADTKTVPDLDRFLGSYEKAGRPVVAFFDEPGHGSTGIMAKGDPGWQKNHAELRDTLWKFYMEGGSGVEWYFGYKTAGGKGGDLALEDFATRDGVYWWSEVARKFFEDLPLERMSDGDGLTSGTRGPDQVLASRGDEYAIYLPKGGSATLDLTGESGTYDVTWHDPRTGATREGSVREVDGGGEVSIGQLSNDGGREWAVTVDRIGGGQPSKGAGAPKPKPDQSQAPKAPNQSGDNVSKGFDGKAPGVYRMKDGLVVMQAEEGDFVLNNASGNKTWDHETALKGYKGSGYLLWDTNKDDFSVKNAGKPSSGPLEYTFRIDGDAADVKGQYYISLRAMKPNTGEKWDRNNDFWVAAGDADDNPSGWKKVFFGGGPNKWLWGTTYDVNHKKSPATFYVDGPGEYSVFIAGRSRKAGLDEIHVQKGSVSRDGSEPTSPVGGAAPSKPKPKPQPEKPAPKPVIDKDDGGGKGPKVTLDDKLAFDRDDIDFRGNKGFIEFSAAQLLKNDKGHNGTVSIHRDAIDGSVRTEDGGKTLVYSFDVKGYDGRDAFGYRIAGEGGDLFSRVYLDVDLSGGGGGNGGGGGGSKPAPKPVAKPAPKPVDNSDDGDDFKLVDARLNKVIAEVGSRAVVEGDSMKGMSINLAAEGPNSAESAVLKVGGKASRVENVEPYSLFGDERGDFMPGMKLSEGQTHKVQAVFHRGNDGKGGVVGRESLEIKVEDQVLRGKDGTKDVFVFHERKMNSDTIVNFEGQDDIAFFGGISTGAVLSKAQVKGKDTVIDFGGGDVLTIKNFTDLGSDDILT